MTNRAHISIVVLALAAACGGASSRSFSATFPDNRPEDVQAVVARLRAAPAPTHSAVAVGVTGSPARLYAIDLTTDRKLWERPIRLRSIPHIAGSTVVTHEESGVVVRDLQTGGEMTTIEDENLHLAGAGGEGDRIAIALSTGGGVGAHSKLFVVEGGSVSWERDLETSMGAPTIRAGMVFVPWATQNVSVLEASNGEELARVRVSDAIVGHAFAIDGEVYVGQSGVFRFTPAIAAGTRASPAYLEPQPGELPGRPPLLRDAYQPPPGVDSAVHRVRLEWRPAGEGDAVELAGDTIYLVFYRQVFALAADGRSARWVYQHDQDIVGATAQPGGLMIADAAGKLAFLRNDDGLAVWHSDTGMRPTVVRFRAGSLTKSGAPEGEPMPLRDQLLAAAENTDARLVPSRALAVRLLADLEEAEVTTNLVAICDDADQPAPIKSAACTALASRTVGNDQVIAALQRHHSFLEQSTPPPVGPLAQAALRMQERRAVPLLIAHLRDPQTPGEHLATLITVLKEMGDRSAAEPIRDFLLMYHADEPDRHLVAALNASIDALVALQGPVAGETLAILANDELGMGGVRIKARQAIAALEAQPAGEGGEATAQAGGEGAESGAGGDAGDDRPERLTAELVSQALVPVEPQLVMCLRRDEQTPQTARVVIAIDGDGTVEMVSVTPQRLQDCVGPLVRGTRFPATRRGVRQQVTHVVRR